MNEEKDRFGDFISLLERAREDVYFAAKERELLDTQKRRVENGKQARQERRAMICPQCGLALHNSSLMDFMVRRCSGCDGIWVDQAVLRQFINMRKIEPDAAYRWSTHSLRYVWPGEQHQVIK